MYEYILISISWLEVWTKKLKQFKYLLISKWLRGFDISTQWDPAVIRSNILMNYSKEIIHNVESIIYNGV